MLISAYKNIFSFIDFTMDIDKEDDEDFYDLFHMDKEVILALYNEVLNSKEIKYWR